MGEREEGGEKEGEEGGKNKGAGSGGVWVRGRRRSVGREGRAWRDFAGKHVKPSSPPTRQRSLCSMMEGWRVECSAIDSCGSTR